MKYLNMNLSAFGFSFIFFLSGCGKFLDEKPRKSLATPATLVDFQALLEHPTSITSNDVVEGEISADDYYVPEELWNSMPENERRMHLWEKEHVYSDGLNSWYWAYTNIYRANTVLDNLDNVSRTLTNQQEWNNVKGQAHYLRAKLFYQVASVWCVAYDDHTADVDLGIPLRLAANFQEPSIRASLHQTYSQILIDLRAAAHLLPNHAVHVIRPSKQSAYGLLARVYLSMRDYENASLYADSCLMLGDELLDYNRLDASITFPIPQYNEEVLAHSTMFIANLVRRGARIKQEFYESYDEDDLRKEIFFNIENDGGISFRANYSGTAGLFGGLALDEVYLIKAEAAVRIGHIEEALYRLNALMTMRYKTGSWTTFDTADPSLVLAKILEERRKELLFRGIRWIDIKRLNKEGANIHIERWADGNQYVLEPNSLRFAVPIPDAVIELSALQQNPY